LIVTLILLAILVLFTVLGLKKGLVRTVLTLIGNVAAFFIARALADWIAPIITGEIPLPGIGTSLTSALNRAELTDRSIETVVRVMTEYGFPETAATAVAGRIDLSDAHSLAVQVSNTLDFLVAYVLVFAAALIVSILLLILLSGVLEGLMKMPILHVVNVISGGVLGFAAGFVLCWVAVLTLSFLAPLVDACFSTTISQIFTASPLYDFFLRTSPFHILL